MPEATHTLRDGTVVSGRADCVALALDIEQRMLAQEGGWVTRLRAAGVKAAHPDDGWVNRDRNTVRLEYPRFNDRPQVGDLIALGVPDRYRLVRVTGLDHLSDPKYASMYGMAPDEPWSYSFEPLVEPAPPPERKRRWWRRRPASERKPS